MQTRDLTCHFDLLTDTQRYSTKLFLSSNLICKNQKNVTSYSRGTAQWESSALSRKLLPSYEIVVGIDRSVHFPPKVNTNVLRKGSFHSREQVAMWQQRAAPSQAK
jgi:hypothetical protein